MAMYRYGSSGKFMSKKRKYAGRAAKLGLLAGIGALGSKRVRKGIGAFGNRRFPQLSQLGRIARQQGTRAFRKGGLKGLFKFATGLR